MISSSLNASNYSFFDKNSNNESENNIINLKLNNNGSKISDLEIFVQSDNNFINTKELKKYFNLKNQISLIEDQIINLNSDFSYLLYGFTGISIRLPFSRLDFFSCKFFIQFDTLFSLLQILFIW